MNTLRLLLDQLAHWYRWWRIGRTLAVAARKDRHLCVCPGWFTPFCRHPEYHPSWHGDD